MFLKVSCHKYHQNPDCGNKVKIVAIVKVGENVEEKRKSQKTNMLWTIYYELLLFLKNDQKQ